MLKRVSIQNFKSLKDVTLDLQKVNLLIGSNNSGKTNFLKAFDFTNYFILNKEKSISNDLFFRRDPSSHLVVHFTFDNIIPQKWGIPETPYEHFVVLSTGNYDFHNPREGTVEWGYSTKIDSQIDVNENVEAVDAFYQYRTGFTVVYSIDPARTKYAYPLLPNNSIIHGDAGNIVSFLDTLRDKYPDNFYQIQDNLQICIPEFSQIRFDTIEPNEDLKETFGDKTFKKLGLYNKIQKATYWSDELSEGTLYFLALLCIVNQPNPPKLLLLEEPEKGIHPRRIREVMDFIFRLAEEKDVQIILTTHNEHVLDDFATRPEAVFVFDKDEEGATYVRNLQRDIIEPTNQRNQELGLDEIDLTTNLSENWLYGLLGGVPSIP